MSADSAPAPARPRWYQFRLRTLLAAVALIAAALWAFRAHYVEPYRAQRQTMELIEELGGRYVAADPVPWQRRLLGSDQQNITLVDLADCDEPEKYLPQIARLPCLETLLLGGPNINDEHLRRLRLISLRLLVLDSTWETVEGLADFHRRFPDVKVLHSDRRAIASLRQAGFAVHTQKAQHAQLENSVGLQFDMTATAVVRRALLQVDDSALISLKGCRHLSMLDLVDTSVGDEDLPKVVTLHRHLHFLSLNGTRVTDAGLKHLRGFRQLEILFLERTNVTDAGLEELKHVPTLRTLHLLGTKVSRDVVRQFQKALPQCAVRWP